MKQTLGVSQQPDVCAPSWTESPTDLEITEAKVLLAEIGLLKKRGLTAEAVVAPPRYLVHSSLFQGSSARRPSRC